MEKVRVLSRRCENGELGTKLSLQHVECYVVAVIPCLQAYGGSLQDGLNRAQGGARDLARWTNELRDAVAGRPGHREFMSALKRAAFTDDGALLFVHAGIDPTLPIDAQKDAFW